MRALTDKSDVGDLLSRASHEYGMTGTVVGYGHLWRHFDIQAPLRSMEVISDTRINKHEREIDGVLWRSMKWSGSTIYDHLEYAIRRENHDLLLLKRIFEKIEGRDLQDLTESIRSKPSAGNARRIWFLYEWLLGERLALADARRSRHEVRKLRDGSRC